jgi:hypothetical protein
MRKEETHARKRKRRAPHARPSPSARPPPRSEAEFDAWVKPENMLGPSSLESFKKGV